MDTFPSSAWAASQNAKCRRLESVSFTIHPSAPDGLLYLCVLANSLLGTPGTAPTDGTNLMSTPGLVLVCQPVIHVSGDAETIDVDAAKGLASPSESVANEGFMFYISTTPPTSVTSAGAFVWTNAMGES